MATTISNKARVGDAFDLLAQGLEPFVSHHMHRQTKREDWADAFVASSRDCRVPSAQSGLQGICRYVSYRRCKYRSTRYI